MFIVLLWIQEEEEPVLPVGWKRCVDEEGEYYWHIRTGRIQRDRPEYTDGNTPTVSIKY